MAVNTKVIKTRIKSVNNTKKITSAMQMIAAAKLRKTTTATLRTREYTSRIKSLLEKFDDSVTQNHPLMEQRDILNELVIIVSSNRGLCGNYNSLVLSKTHKFLSNREKENPNLKIDILAIGKKSAQYAKKTNHNLIAVYEKLTDNLNYSSIKPLLDELIEMYLEKKYDRIGIVYTYFKSSLHQEVRWQQLMPVPKVLVSEFISQSTKPTTDDIPENERKYTYEPNPNKIFRYLIPRLMESVFYQTLLESTSSEHSSRMVAMKNASDNAIDMVNSLMLEYNKERQAAITQEIAEIANAAEALKYNKKKRQIQKFQNLTKNNNQTYAINSSQTINSSQII